MPMTRMDRSFDQEIATHNTDSTNPTDSTDHTGRPSLEHQKSYHTQLVVHFDINETILVGDVAGGDTREDCFNKILAKSAFVRIPESDNNIDWEQTEPTHWWDGTPFDDTTTYPSLPPSSSSSPPPLYTGWKWPPNSVPYYRTAWKKRSSTFTTGHGKIYRPLYEQLQTKVAVPHSASLELPEILSHMIPSVFYTLKILMERPQPTRIVFRTFGTDLPLIAKAITCFARGQHPDYLDFHCEELLLDGSNLFRGRWNDQNVYQLWTHDGDTLLASGGHAILEFISTKPCCGIQDDYDFWAAHQCAPWAGKPVWVPQDRSVHHVLLDDNIHPLEYDGIASVHEQQTTNGDYRTLSGAEILEQQGIHLIRVPTIEPILNDQWFIDQLDRAQLRFEVKHCNDLH